MSLPVVIENDAVRMEVWPRLGGKVSSVCDKADQFELLYNYPAELPTDSSAYGLPYANGWNAGWDECFPAVGTSAYADHPYDGIAVPDHGELWSIPCHSAVPTRHGITTVWYGLRFGYRLTRNLYLDGPAVVAEYALVNLAPFEFRFVWAQHALFSLAQPVQIDLARGGPFRWSHDAAHVDIQKAFEWPMLEGTASGGGSSGGVSRGGARGTAGEEGPCDLTRPAELPAGRAWKVFSADPIESPLVLRYPGRSRTVKVEYSSEDELPAYWGLWFNTGGWAKHRHFSVEPTTGRYDQIDRSAKDRSAGTVPACGRRNWAVRWSLA